MRCATTLTVAVCR